MGVTARYTAAPQETSQNRMFDPQPKHFVGELTSINQLYEIRVGHPPPLKMVSLTHSERLSVCNQMLFI